MSTAAERYLQHLDSIFGRDPRLFHDASRLPGVPGVTAIVYENMPEDGYVTGLTFGLSHVEHPAWTKSRPELCLTVKSEDLGWGKVAAYVANALRGDCPFCYGESINFKQPISDDSEMDAFFVFAPSILAPEAYLNIDIGKEYKISISGLYPFYSDEMALLQDIGLKEFWHHPDFDMYDVNRKRINIK